MNRLSNLMRTSASSCAWPFSSGSELVNRHLVGKMFCGYRSVAAIFAVCVLLTGVIFPVVVRLEFRHDPDPWYMFKLYPHLLLFPLFFLWAALWTTGMAVSLAMKYRPELKTRIISTAAVTL